jgi:hypothetical protein
VLSVGGNGLTEFLLAALFPSAHTTKNNVQKLKLVGLQQLFPEKTKNFTSLMKVLVQLGTKAIKHTAACKQI